eukprot:530540-Pyramimonas_sp.AAC.1
MHAIRAIAGSSPEIQAAQRWITEAMNPAVDEEQFKEAGRFQRLDLMVATHLIEQFTRKCAGIVTCPVITYTSFSRSLEW